MSYEESAFSESIIIILLKGLYANNIDDIKTYLESLGHLLLIQDSCQQLRIEMILGYLISLIYPDHSNAKVPSKCG